MDSVDFFILTSPNHIPQYCKAKNNSNNNKNEKRIVQFSFSLWYMGQSNVR